jgi:3-phenylpropionate/trans-cinnamate dioxygenase ferredoxin reductase subunit
VSPRPGLVVVGASIAGVRTVEALRRRGYDPPITLIGAEEHLPYDRPPLSKQFLRGEWSADELALVTPDALAALDLELRLGTSATALEPAARQLVAGDDRLPYETLVIATGSTPRRPAGWHRAGVHTLRTVEDAVAIRAGLDSGARVAIVGGGFIGAEVASAARALGLEVTIVDPLPALMVRGLGLDVGTVLAARHVANGVTLRLGRSVARLVGGERIERLELDDGSTVDADLVVVGIGVDPTVDWLAGSGLDCAGGIACDAGLRAGDGLYAVGDVARWPGPAGLRRAEHWTNAVDQAAAVAASIMGEPVAYDPLPYVWSDQLGKRLQVWGEVTPDDELVYVSGDSAADEFVAAFGRAGRLRAVVALGARRDALRAMRQLAAGAGWEPGGGPVESPA